MSVAVLDLILIGVTLFSAFLAMVRGFSREVLSVASWAAAAVAAFMFYKALTPMVQPYVSSETVASVIAAGLIFLVVLIIVSLITMRIADFIIDSRIGALDRSLGFLFGAARGVLLVVVANLFLGWLVGTPGPDWMATAKSRPMLNNLGQQLLSALPDTSKSSILQRINPQEPEAPENAEPAAENDA